MEYDYTYVLNRAGRSGFLVFQKWFSESQTRKFLNYILNNGRD